MSDAHVDLLPPGKDGNNTEDSYMVVRRYQNRETEVEIYSGPEARQLWRRLDAHFGAEDTLVGEIEQTIATLRGEADEIEAPERAGDVGDIAGQLRHRADDLEDALEAQFGGVDDAE